MKSKKEKSESAKPNPPPLIQVDITPKLYEQIKRQVIEEQHALVRPYLEAFVNFLRSLDPLDVYEAIEQGHTIKNYYDQSGNYDLKITLAAARAILKASRSMREKLNKAMNPSFAKLVLRFENPEVYEIVTRWGGDDYLEKNIRDFKKILGVIKE